MKKNKVFFSFKLFKLNHFKSSKYGFKNCWICPNISGMVVACNYDLTRPNLQCGPFSLCRKWIVVSPNLEVVTQTLVFFLKVIYDDYVLLLVTIPPLVGHLYKGSRVVCSRLLRFASTCLPVVPLVD